MHASLDLSSDVAVIGAGPAGSFTALNLARNGIGTTVFEEHEQIGIPSHCAGHLSIKSLNNLGLCPLPAPIVENRFRGAKFYSPNGRMLRVRFPNPVTCSVNRELLDKHLATLAQKNGANYQLNSRVESLHLSRGFVEGVLLNKNGKIERHKARITVDAEGISSRLLRQSGLELPKREHIMNAIEAEMSSVKDVEIDSVEVYLGESYAPGFYAWLIPKPDGQAKIGLAARSGNPKQLYERFIRKHPVASKRLGKSRTLHMAFHPISLGGPIPRAFSNGFLVVGDAASQVKPTTGGGVIMGLTCARLAAETACQAAKSNDISESVLGQYQEKIKKSIGLDMSAMLRIRRILNAISDSQLDKAFAFFNKVDFGKVLTKVDDIDFQGRSLMKVIRGPRAFAALAYLFYICLSTYC